MNAAVRERPDLHAAHHAALATRSASRLRLDAAADALARATATAEEWRAKVRDTTAAEQSAGIAEAPALAQARRDAEAGSAAAERQRQAALAAHADAERALTAVDSEVRRLADRIAYAERQALRAERLRAEAAVIALREREMGFDNICGLSTARERWDAAYRKPFTAEFAGVPIPLIAADLGWPEERANAGRIQQAATEWRERIAALCEGK